MEAPKANPEKLLTILQDAYEGKVVLPEFQRNFLWSRDSIEELLVSILQGYFVGTVLLLDTQSSNPLFPFRNIEGLDLVNPNARPNSHSTIRLALDGQQKNNIRTLVSPESNREIKRAKRPPEYLPIFLKKHGDDEMRLHKTLRSHFISDDALAAMRVGKDGVFEDFIQARQKEIAEEIQQRTS